jgi:hypothetical protein
MSSVCFISLYCDGEQCHDNRREEKLTGKKSMQRIRNAYNILGGKPGGKKPLGGRRRKWEDDIRMDIREIGWEGVDCMHVAQDRDQWLYLVNTIMNFGVT